MSARLAVYVIVWIALALTALVVFTWLMLALNAGQSTLAIVLAIALPVMVWMLHLVNRRYMDEV